MQQEKSRALDMTAERAARSSVLVISRTMPSSLLAMTVITTGSRASDRGLRLGSDFGFALVLALILAFVLAIELLAMTSRYSGRRGSRWRSSADRPRSSSSAPR